MDMPRILVIGLAGAFLLCCLAGCDEFSKEEPEGQGRGSEFELGVAEPDYDVILKQLAARLKGRPTPTAQAPTTAPDSTGLPPASGTPGEPFPTPANP